VIRVFEGTPGSGKTLHATEDGIIGMNRRGGVVANYIVTRPKRRNDGSEKWIYLPEEEMTPARLIAHAEKYHRRGREGEGLIIIDECHRVLNSRTTWTGRQKVATQQLELVRFLAEHRHFGFDVILCVQNMEMLDKHARFLPEYRVKHFKVNQFWWLAWVPFPLFGRVTYNAQFRTMKGRFDVSTGMLSLRRYDYQAMRLKVAGAFAPVALAPAPGGFRLVAESNHTGPIETELPGAS
jgi:zona occludens toxin